MGKIINSFKQATTIFEIPSHSILIPLVVKYLA